MLQSQCHWNKFVEACPIYCKSVSQQRTCAVCRLAQCRVIVTARGTCHHAATTLPPPPPPRRKLGIKPNTRQAPVLCVHCQVYHAVFVLHLSVTIQYFYQKPWHSNKVDPHGDIEALKHTTKQNLLLYLHLHKYNTLQVSWIFVDVWMG